MLRKLRAGVVLAEYFRKSGYPLPMNPRDASKPRALMPLSSFFGPVDRAGSVMVPGRAKLADRATEVVCGS